MRIATLLLLTIIMTTEGFSQTVDIKKDTVYIDKKPFLVWETEFFIPEISVHHINSNEEEIFIIYEEYRNPFDSSETIQWIELNFITLNKKVEIPTRFEKSLIKFLIRNKVYVDGKLNIKAIDKLLLKYGTRFSDNRPNGSRVIIINNN